MKLIKYRDAGMHTYTYFWINDKDKVISPYFDSEEQANEWIKSHENPTPWKSMKRDVE